ncbi:MAG: guanylate kinase [Lachnospiraceae bacterium]
MLLLCGKTCTGKSTIQKELIKIGMKSVVPYTTRPLRGDEIDGEEYHFITQTEFLEREAQGFFAETKSYDVATGEKWFYGSAVKDLTEDKVLIVNPYGLIQIRKIKSLNPIAFYLISGEETIWNRLRQRGDDSAEARRRLNADDKDFVGIEEDIDFLFRSDLGLKPELLAEMILYTYNKVRSFK